MLRWALGLLGAAVIAVAALLLLDLGDSPAPAPEPAPPAAVPPAAPRADQPPGRPAPAPRVEPETPGGEEEDPEIARAAAVEVHRMEVLLAGDVPQQIMRAAARCYQNEPGRTERMEIDYRLRFRAGVATLSGVTLKSSEINAPRLEQCVVDTLRSLTWEDPQAPDLDRDMTASLSILDLRARARRFGE